jgi:hypothetical protein
MLLLSLMQMQRGRGSEDSCWGWSLPREELNFGRGKDRARVNWEESTDATARGAHGAAGDTACACHGPR